MSEFTPDYAEKVSREVIRELLETIKRLESRIAELEAWSERAVASMDRAALAAGVQCCDLIPERIAELEDIICRCRRLHRARSAHCGEIRDPTD